MSIKLNNARTCVISMDQGSGSIKIGSNCHCLTGTTETWPFSFQEDLTSQINQSLPQPIFPISLPGLHNPIHPLIQYGPDSIFSWNIRNKYLFKLDKVMDECHPTSIYLIATSIGVQPLMNFCQT